MIADLLLEIFYSLLIGVYVVILFNWIGQAIPRAWRVYPWAALGLGIAPIVLAHGDLRTLEGISLIVAGYTSILLGFLWTSNLQRFVPQRWVWGIFRSY